VAGILILAAVYFAAGSFGLSFASINPSASAVWPPSGISLAVLLLWGRRLWPGVFIGAFAVNVVKQKSIWTALAIASGNSLEALAGAFLLTVFARGARSFETVGGVFRFLLLAALGSTAISATVGVTTLCLGGHARWSEYHSVWLTWWLGDVISDIIIAPLLIIWVAERSSLRLRPRQALEAVALFLSIILVSQVVFPADVPIQDKNIPLGYWMLLPLLWAAFRFGLRGAVTAAFISSVLALRGTLHGFGPFVKETVNLSILFVQTFVGTITSTALILAAVNAERRRAEAERDKALAIVTTERDRLRESEQALTRHKQQLEETVAERTARLTEIVQELEAFSYSIAHDMRAPLRAMQGYGKILLEDFSEKLGEDGNRAINRIISSANRLDHLIRDILDYSRMVRSELPLGEINIQALMEEIIHSYPNLNSHATRIDIQRPLPPILGNTAALTQVISNLLGNAVKFVAPGTTPRVRVYAEAVTHHAPQHSNAPSLHHSGSPFVRFWFEDNGIGIAPEFQQRVFGMFQRLNRPDLYEGTGIGLAIVRKAVERMGGRAGIESQPGKGSRFWVELKRANPFESGKHSTAAQTSVQTGNGGDRR
jgi:signal transduction histidine kinase